jgi:hypothetical protein
MIAAMTQRDSDKANGGTPILTESVTTGGLE